MKHSLTFAATAAALLCGTAALAQTTVTTGTTAVTGDGASTQTSVAATVPTTKVVSETGSAVKETVTTAPITTAGAVKTATTVRSADGQDLVQTTVNADGTASTAVASDVPVKRSVKYVGDKKIETTKTTVVTEAPVNVVTTSATSEGDAVAVSTTATPNGNAAAIAPAVSTTTTTATMPAASPSYTADASSGTAGTMSTGMTWNLASFDTNNDSQLTPLEFGQMVLAAQAPASGGNAAANRERYSKKSNNAATDVLNQTAAAFGKADANRDFRVSADELAMWQSNGSPM